MKRESLLVRAMRASAKTVSVLQLAPVLADRRVCACGCNIEVFRTKTIVSFLLGRLLTRLPRRHTGTSTESLCHDAARRADNKVYGLGIVFWEGVEALAYSLRFCP